MIRKTLGRVSPAAFIWQTTLAAMAIISAAGCSWEAAAQMAPGGQTTFKAGQLVIEAPWVRATPAGAKTAAAYLKITNKGTEPDRLVGGTVPIAGSVAVHEMSMAGGVMKMRQLEKGLEIKPGETVELKPGGNHVMFEGLKEPVREGKSIKGTLQFEKAGTVEVEFATRPIGASSGGQMGGHMKH